jgi:hypothetical protein
MKKTTALLGGRLLQSLGFDSVYTGGFVTGAAARACRNTSPKS